MKEKIDRRNLLKFFASGVGAATLIPTNKAQALSCLGPTPAQPKGPFYPVTNQSDINNDLTKIEGRSESAKGEIIFIEGQVVDKKCLPIKGALVEIWQASANGHYNHPGDSSNPEGIDPNFQYWGECLTDEEGKYSFKSIKPGSYPAGDGWVRPPHIHFKVSKLAYFELITQMYFADEMNLNEQDLILKSLSSENQEKVIIDFAKEAVGSRGVFNISLRKVR